MKPYFESMPKFGKALKKGRIERAVESAESLRQAEEEIGQLKKDVESAGFPTEKINQRGMMTVWQRIEYLADPGSWP